MQWDLCYRFTIQDANGRSQTGRTMSLGPIDGTNSGQPHLTARQTMEPIATPVQRVRWISPLGESGLSSAEFRNEYSCTFTPLYAFITGTRKTLNFDFLYITNACYRQGRIKLFGAPRQ